MPAAVRRLAALGVKPDGHPLRGIRYVDERHHADARFRHGHGLGVRRTVLHAALAERAAALGIPVMIVGTHALAVFSTAALQHGNIRLPECLERVLQPVLVTVDMHRIHHSVVFEQANSNYGAVLSVWDRLFGSYTSISRAQHEGIVFGVRELPRRDCLKPSAMLLTPWRIPRALAMN